MGGKVCEIDRQVERKHIFTHIEWHMRGYYMELREKLPQFTWMSKQQIREQAALPTAFRIFFDEIV